MHANSSLALLSIGEIATVKGGKRLPLGSSLTSAKTSHPYIRIVDMKNGSVDVTNLMYVPEQVFESISRYTISKNDLYISIVGTIGIVGSIPAELDGANLTENAAKIIITDKDVDVEYVKAYLLSHYGQQEISKRTVGSTQPKLSLFRIADIPVPLPPLPEQRAITAVLGSLDDKIELNRRMNQTLEAIAQALFKSWFVDFDPVRAKQEGRAPDGMDAETAALFPSEFEDSELGQIPKEWTISNLGAIAANVRRQASPAQIAPGTHYIGLEHMPRQSIALDSWASADGVASDKFRFERGNILFGKLRPYFHKVGMAAVDGVCSTDIVVLEPTSSEWLSFLLAHVSSKAFVKYTDTGEGSKMPRTNWYRMSSYPVVLPSENVALAYNSLILPLLHRIQVNIQEGRSLATIRDILLPKLISGEIRVLMNSN